MLFVKLTLTGFVSLCLLISSISLANETQLDKDMRHIPVPYDSIEFLPLMNGPIQIAVLSGNLQTGPSSIMLRFPPKFPGVMHYHNSSYHAVVISGVSKHWVEGEDEASAPLQKKGDYWYQAGKQPHQDSFPSDQVTTVFLRFEGPLDLHLAEENVYE
jgi:hypothetical protein